MTEQELIPRAVEILLEEIYEEDIHEDTDWLDNLPEEHSINLDWDDV